MKKFFSIEREIGNISVVVFNRTDVEMNIFSEAVLRELNEVLEELAGDPGTEGVVFISGKPDQFVVGADIADISSFKTVEEATGGARAMQHIFQKVAKLGKPTVAAINGPCLGGGLELSLACTWRVATSGPKTKLGLPEIQLGLIPGAGGTQRLPRLIGIQTALDMILTGKRLDGARAYKAGLVDACVPERQLRQHALAFASKKRSSASSAPKKSFAQDLPKLALEGNPIGRKIIAKKAREMVDDKTKGFYPASYKALEAVFEGFEMTIEKGLELEAALFGQLVVTRESKSLIHLFHATTAIKKHPYRDAGKERFGENKAEKIGVIGAGFMGAGIAAVCAEKDMRVMLSDPNTESLGRCLRHIRDYFAKKVERRRLKRFEMKAKMSRVSPELSPIGFDQADMVIEAVFEDLKLKQKLLAQIEASGKGDWIFASNTSALPIASIAAESKSPDRVIGMHFFSPVEKMPLLEVIVTDKTAPWVAARTVDLGQAMGKQVIVVKDGPGFYTTRALAFFLAEAASILLEGASIDQIDRALTEFGFPVGPITLIDEVGIDVGIHVLETIEKAFPARMKVPKGLQPLADAGRLGRKNNKGFYTYAEGKKGAADRTVYSLLGLKDPGSGSKTSATDIVDRCVLVFVAESIRCLEEGILLNAHDGDVGAVFGLGFPPFLGGPFRYVDHMTAGGILDKLNTLAEKHGERFAPPKMLKDLAASGKLFFPNEA